MKDNNSVQFFVRVSEDKEGLVNIPIQIGSFKTKKDAKNAMHGRACMDLVEGRYYFYHLIEQKTTIHETYPSIETSE